jgi:PleD family two-component response regulator
MYPPFLADDAVARKERPIALIACRNDAMGRSLESVFEEDGYIPARITSVPRTLELTRRASYDVIVLNQGLEEDEVLHVSRSLRDDPLFDHSTPIVITSAGPVAAQARMTAYEAGAWEYCSHPIDIELVLTKLRTFLRARQEVRAAQAQTLIDSRSGLYTPFGLHQIALTLGAGATRKHQPFACVAFSSSSAEGEASTRKGRDANAAFAEVADVFRIQSRKSDVVGHVGPSRVAILAPDTDAAGARLLVARLQREFDRAASNHTIPAPVRLRAGFSAVPDLASSHIDVEVLVTRAQNALNHAHSRGGTQSVVSFDELA